MGIGHVHPWTSWGPWREAGNGQEARSRTCIDRKCNATQTKWRKKKPVKRTPTQPNKNLRRK